MEAETSRQDDTKAGPPSVHTEPARLDKYTILELARLGTVPRKVVIENWLESVYGRATASATVTSEGFAPLEVSEHGSDHGSDNVLETFITRESSPGEGQDLGSRPPTTTGTSGLCDVDTHFVERKTYKWRNWATESV